MIQFFKESSMKINKMLVVGLLALAFGAVSQVEAADRQRMNAEQRLALALEKRRAEEELYARVKAVGKAQVEQEMKAQRQAEAAQMKELVQAPVPVRQEGMGQVFIVNKTGIEGVLLDTLDAGGLGVVGIAADEQIVLPMKFGVQHSIAGVFRGLDGKNVHLTATWLPILNDGEKLFGELKMNPDKKGMEGDIKLTVFKK
jgi:hypothetical protein